MKLGRLATMRSTIVRFFILLAFVAIAHRTSSQIAARVSGEVVDPNGAALAGAHIQIASSNVRLNVTSDSAGSFSTLLPRWGTYTVRVEAAGFVAISRQFDLSAANATLTLRLEQVATTAQDVIVTTDVSEIALASPDPSEKVMVREELLDANPGRPGAPVSIPGLPIETASGGIKAPQYFVPGVAGDHGEPIAQYIAVGGFLVPNNLSANAHGNGYADPNIYISAALGSVETDGGAFNVLEGNHALNLAATYSLRPHLKRFVTLTGDYRDIDLTGGFAPSDPAKKEWLALEANYGNGLMRRLEHRQQYKWNALRIFDPGNHEITLFSIGYWGISHEGNLVPLGFGVQVNDTSTRARRTRRTPRFWLRTISGRPATTTQLAFSGFFRTYNLALFSNFGEGLIRQSEFRTVEGAEARETHTFTPWLEAMAGLHYNEDDIHQRQSRPLSLRRSAGLWSFS